MRMETDAAPRRKSLTGSRRRLAAAVVSFMALATGIMATAPAHDGGFGHSQRTIAACADERGWTIEYRIGLGADEALVELAQHQEADFFVRRGRQLATTLRVTAPEGATLVFTGHTIGPALTQTYRYRLDTPAERIVLQDDCFPHKPGVVRCVGGAGVRVTLAAGIDWAHAERATVEFARTR
ncbi:MAG: hypothetical protein ACKOHK_03150 [Planctomycetia bacterium]